MSTKQLSRHFSCFSHASLRVSTGEIDIAYTFARNLPTEDYKKECANSQAREVHIYVCNHLLTELREHSEKHGYGQISSLSTLFGCDGFLRRASGGFEPTPVPRRNERVHAFSPASIFYISLQREKRLTTYGCAQLQEYLLREFAARFSKVPDTQVEYTVNELHVKIAVPDGLIDHESTIEENKGERAEAEGQMGSDEEKAEKGRERRKKDSG